MTINKIQKGLVLAILSTGLFAAGCELIVDFDRTRIPIEDAGGPLPDATSDGAVADAASDATETDASDAGDLDASDGSDDDASDGAVDQ